ncbi:killer cell lectin-like receptor subfamily B member 1F [Lagopus leucura]|uniref:killer cell lectin-like receptor subfamily B member 1F n=1 Tax=Lagopus leucura TaxID=30410 RepID=UPI001C67335F|nr:killer cell lectin-like receptor subfamily B member 1F [Lagopus leucura]
MDEEITYADLRQHAGCLSPAKQQHVWALPARWLFQKVGVLGLLLLLLLLVGLSVWVFQKTTPPPSTAQHCPETSGTRGMQLSGNASIEQFFCQSTPNSSAAPAACLLCPQFWRLLGDQCYRLSMRKGNWTQAKRECENLQSQLVVLRKKAEKDNLKEIAGAVNQPVWIGLEVSKNQWKWVDNSSFNTTEFGNLASMENHCRTFKNTEVEDDACNGEHEWICQKEPLHLHP